MIYLGTQGLLRDVPVKNVRAFEEAFLHEMEVRLADVLAEFKKGNLAEDGIKRMADFS